MHNQAVLSIDAGSQSVRAALYSMRGKRLEMWRQPCHHDIVRDAQVEHDAESIVLAVRSCLNQVPSRFNVVATGLVSQGASIVCWDRSSGEPLSPVMSWQDRRGEPYVQRLQLTNDDVHVLTGLPLSCHYGASKLRWCLEHSPKVQEALRAGRLAGGPLVSFLLYRLCQDEPMLVDTANASRTQLWNLHERCWDVRLTESFGVPTEILPDGTDNLSSFGHIDLSDSCAPLILVHRDQQAALFARGWPQMDTAYINIGTGAFVQCLTATPNGSTKQLINRVLTGGASDPPLFSLEGTVHGAAGATEWMEREVGSPISSQHLNDALALDPEEGKSVYFINGIMGMGSPYWRPTVTCRFGPRLSDGEKLLAWLESIVFMLIGNLRVMMAKEHVERIHVSGGWSRLSGVVQRLADLSGLECYCDGDQEASLRGAAFLAAGQPDDWHVETSEAFSPRENPSLERRFNEWKQQMAEVV